MLDQNEIELFRDNVKKFLENEVAPHYDQWEKAEMFPRELWNKMVHILAIRRDGHITAG